ncbi:hypothetical protein T492DRAFT_884894 [Pavlovales sp. CCMP2436]|nr:hypothetical protein T492DRAFT_884894 [Pavlovales sp. CCMP2436]
MSQEQQNCVGADAAPPRGICRVALSAEGAPNFFKRLAELPTAAWRLQRDKRAHRTVLDSSVRSPVRSTLLLLANVPTHVTPRQLRFFFGELAPLIRHAWLLRDGAGHRYGALLSACCTEHSELLRGRLHGLRFSPVDVEVAIVLPISSMAFAPSLESPERAAGEGPAPAPTPAEAAEAAHWCHLPTCAVCLTRLEPSTSGAVTRACTHASNCLCLSLATANGCRVCATVEDQREDARRTACPGGGETSAVAATAAAARSFHATDQTSAVVTTATTATTTATATNATTAGTSAAAAAFPAASKERSRFDGAEGSERPGSYRSGASSGGGMPTSTGQPHVPSCAACGETDRLWICLRVWDYDRDRFVHRLMAIGGFSESGDGPDFELEGGEGSAEAATR